mmetsp:Transcript_3038/g.4391  ORF Transcript_3038/g.4391 Transcript_3038/m.4391 type:complete len:389 (-) Transcript_3038:110-1276(-)|eukprot:CAMPEP_0116031432 /NCGR_PEP_ID=MMETSP0321-20121206/17505_1 /TAXON_ID=163516 /ORGANISM="Leptocylindrus danicus var. danicus, Strain B650" /LENGTH=388 /DNA_ID=CAMNT_0003506545 /DNA_START=122 /DNA_END=1288 /DNA_ORIENTATION=-
MSNYYPIMLCLLAATVSVEAYTSSPRVVQSSSLRMDSELPHTSNSKLAFTIPNGDNIMKSKSSMPWSKSIAADSDSKEGEGPPLLYMPFWTWQSQFMEQHLTDLAPVQCPPEFQYQENLEKKARIVNECYTSKEYSKIRMTYYDAGEGCQVFNSLWYPHPESNLPLLGIDLLSFNRKRFLAIVDFQPLYDMKDADRHSVSDKDLEGMLQPIKAKYESLQGQMSSKFYDETQFFSKQMLFARFENEDVVADDLMPAFQEYVATHVQMVQDSAKKSGSVDTNKKSVLDRYSKYDTYSAVRDPATGLFAAMFGKEWADDFVYDFLFSRSDREAAAKENVVPFGAPRPPAGGTGAGKNPMAQSSAATQGGGNPMAQTQEQKQSAPVAVGARR